MEEVFVLLQEYEEHVNGMATPRIEISNYGNVLRNGAVYIPPLNNWGYPVISMSFGVKLHQYRLSRLVCTAFNGMCPPGRECCHIDGNPLNNRADNLRWDTSAANSRDSVRHGTCSLLGKGRLRLFPSKSVAKRTVVEIRQKCSSGTSVRDLAAEYNLSAEYVREIVSGRVWRTCGGPIRKLQAMVFVVNGQAVTSRVADRILGRQPGTTLARVRRGMSPEAAVNTPCRAKTTRFNQSQQGGGSC